MSAFHNLLDEIRSKKCPTCDGLGAYDDADFGDTSFCSFKCTACKGTGFKDGQAYQAVTVQTDSPCKGG